MRNEYSAGIVLFHKNRTDIEYLVIKHSKGHWSFPKGHIEKGETKLETARREVEEETGISDVEVIDTDLLLRDEYIYDFGKKGIIFKHVYYFIGEAKIKTTSIDVSEVLDYRWCDYESAHNLITYEQTKKVLEEAHKIISEYIEKEKF